MRRSRPSRSRSPDSKAGSGLSIEDKGESLAHVAALETFTQPPDAGVEDKMRHHGPDKSAVDGEAIRPIADIRRQHRAVEQDRARRRYGREHRQGHERR